MTPLLLQVCDPNVALVDHVTDFEFIKAVTCTYVNAASMTVVGLMVYSAVAGSIYIRTNSLMIPLALLLLTGGAIMTQVAAVATPFAVLLLLLVPAGVLAYAYYRYSF